MVQAMRIFRPQRASIRAAALAGALLVPPAGCGRSPSVAPGMAAGWAAAGLPDEATLRRELNAVRRGANGGFGVDLWATVLDREGVAVAVVFTGTAGGTDWSAGRRSSAEKASTANALSLPDFALSTANLYSAVQPGGALFGLHVAVPAASPATSAPAATRRLGGLNALAGGVPLYNRRGVLVGALGVSGDTPCADHNVAWRVRDRLRLDHVPAGVSATNDDNIVYDVANGRSTGGWGHPTCSAAATTVGNALPATNRVGPA